MKEILTDSLFPILLTLSAYQAGVWCQKKWKTPLMNPLLVAVVLVILVLCLTGLPLPVYQDGCQAFSWLLTPATVCLAIPLYEQLQVLRRQLWAICAGVAAGTISCLLFILLFAVVSHFGPELTISLLPKSITTAMGTALAELGGGIVSITTAAIICTGIAGSLLGPLLCRFFRLTDPVAQGTAFGTASHVIGTAKASEMGELTGAVSSLSLVAARALTAVLFPLICLIV